MGCTYEVAQYKKSRHGKWTLVKTTNYHSAAVAKKKAGKAARVWGDKYKVRSLCGKNGINDLYVCSKVGCRAAGSRPSARRVDRRSSRRRRAT